MSTFSLEDKLTNSRSILDNLNRITKLMTIHKMQLKKIKYMYIYEYPYILANGIPINAIKVSFFDISLFLK